MKFRTRIPFASNMTQRMALVLFLLFHVAIVFASNGEMALANVTRFASGDIFALIGTDCGLTRCMEMSHGTAMAATSGAGCMCQCRPDTPTFREDQGTCVNHIDECLMASFGRGVTNPQIPFVFLPLKGQIIYPSKEIIFTDVEDAICAVTSAQYLSASGWVTLRDFLDNDVPFGLYRDEGSTFLQWRGSAALHARLEGRLVAAHVLCSAASPSNLVASCAAFRIAGASHDDVRSIPFHAGEIVTAEVTTPGQGLSVLESLAIGVCVLMLIFVYAAGIIFYVHYKQRQKRKEKDPELNLSNTISTDNSSTLDSRIDMDNMRIKSNPLLKMDGLANDFLHDAGLSDVSEHTEDTMDSSPNNTQRFQKINSNVTSAVVHTRRKKPSRPTIRATSTPERMTERLQRRSASPDIERAPQSDLSIVDCTVDSNANQKQLISNGEPVIRRKLYFNPVFFETEHLKNPPPAAVEFLVKIREVMAIAKEKMTSKRFIPILTDIPEEELYHTIDLGWDIPCARRGRRFSAISLKRENSRRAVHCGGCPGCDSSVRAEKATNLNRSNSCKTCVRDDYKQKVVQKWLNEVPLPHVKPTKSVAKVTPRIMQPKHKDELNSSLPDYVRNKELKTVTVSDITVKEALVQTKESLSKQAITVDNSNISIVSNRDQVTTTTITSERKKSPSNHITRKVRKRLPPPPPPPITPSQTKNESEDDVESIPPEIKEKMKAVIKELSKCQRVEPKELDDMKIETADPISPKIVIPVIAADSHYYSDDNMLCDARKRDLYAQRENYVDSLERSVIQRRRRYSMDCGPEIARRHDMTEPRKLQVARERLSQSWLDVKKAVEGFHLIPQDSGYENKSRPVNEIFVNRIEPVYNNIPTLGALTIEVRGSPIEKRRNQNEEFDPDTLDRKPKPESKKRVEKILLKSGGSFKHKAVVAETEEKTIPSTEDNFTRKIGSLRQIYEAKAKVQEANAVTFFESRGSVPSYANQDLENYVSSLKTPDLIRQIDCQKEPKPPIPPKSRRGSDASVQFITANKESPPGRRASEERDRFPPYSRVENLNARRSGRRSARTRSRRTDLKKLCRTEDSGYMSTDSNESKRARYLMQLRPKFIPPELNPVMSNLCLTRPSNLQIESDTDELESLCDGRSESGGESVETDSVFFGNFDDNREMLTELGLKNYEVPNKVMQTQEQIDSGFVGETNIILSGDSDSEHRSVISIVTGRDGRASAASIRLDEAPYVRSVEC